MESESHDQMIARTVAQTATDTAKAVRDAAFATAQILAEKGIENASIIAVLQTNMKNLEKQQTSFESSMNTKIDRMTMTFEKVFARLDDIIQGRPTWAVAIIIGVLSSTVVGLSVFTFTHVAR